MRKPSKTTQRSTSVGTSKDPVNSHFLLLCLFLVTSVYMVQNTPVLVGSPSRRPSADIDTRRRAACDLVRGLCKFFEAPVTAIFSGYVNSMLAEYAKNPGLNWKHKDAAIYLVTSLASKAQTQKVLSPFGPLCCSFQKPVSLLFC